AGPDAGPRDATHGRCGTEQLVRVRRPEHGADLQAVGRMTDDARTHDGDPGEADETAAATPGMEVAADPATPAAPRDRADVALLALIDRLAALLDRSDLTELEVEAGETGLILRKPEALAAVSVLTAGAPAAVAAAPEPAAAMTASGEPSAAGREGS